MDIPTRLPLPLSLHLGISVADTAVGLCLPYQARSSSLLVPPGRRSSLTPAWICSLLFVLVTAWSVSFRSPPPPGSYPSGFMTNALSGVGSVGHCKPRPHCQLGVHWGLCGGTAHMCGPAVLAVQPLCHSVPRDGPVPTFTAWS